MNDHLKRNEAELNELLAEYWALRNRTCKRRVFCNVAEGLMSLMTAAYMETIATKLGIGVSSV